MWTLLRNKSILAGQIGLLRLKILKQKLLYYLAKESPEAADYGNFF